MTPVNIGAAVLGAAAFGAYLRWAITPVSIAYRIGRAIGRRAW